MNPQPRAHGRAPWGRACVLALSCFLVAACGPLRSRQVDTIRYRNCSVITNINYETRQTSHLLGCNGPPADRKRPKDVPYAIMTCYPGDPVTIVLYPGSYQFHSGKFIRVRYRFNGHRPVEGAWLWLQSDTVASAYASPSILKDFLDGITARETLLFQVGREQAQVSFRADATRALRDWQNRCAASEG